MPLTPSLNNWATQKQHYLVGEIAEWYPEVPQKIVAAGHELGLHCHIHHPAHQYR